MGLSVPCSQLEPLCAGVRGMTQRLLELRLHIARVGQAVSAAGGSHRESGPPQSRGGGRLPSGHGADRDRDVWFGAQSEWSPLAPRLWSGPADRFHIDDPSLKPLGAKDLRSALASSLALNEDMHQGAAIEALRLGDDWLLYWRQMSDRFSLWFDGRIDVEPRVLFMPQAGVTSRGRAWARGAQLVSVGCEPFDPFNSMEPFPVAPSTNDELYEHTKKVEDLVRSRGSEHGALVAIGQVGCIGPAHMILECLPRLLAARQLTARTPGTVLLTAQSNNLSHAILEAAGIDATVPSTIGKAAAALVVLPENTHCMQPSIGQLLLLRRFISAGLQRCPSPLLAAENLLPQEHRTPVREPLDSREEPPDRSNWQRRARGQTAALRFGASGALLTHNGGNGEYGGPPAGPHALERPCDAAAELTQMLVASVGVRASIHAVGVDSTAG